MHCYRMLLLLALLVHLPAQGSVWLEQGAIQGRLPLLSWKQLRDRSVEKQDLDYSCGAAALATLLRFYFRIDSSEAEVLARLPRNTRASSFALLADLASTAYGLGARGLALDFDALQRLQVPVLVYLEVGGQGHFSVLRGIDERGKVWLADPSWGNRLLSRHQFMVLWSTRSDTALPGKILMLDIPARAAPRLYPDIDREYFVRRALELEIRRSRCRNCGDGLL